MNRRSKISFAHSRANFEALPKAVMQLNIFCSVHRCHTPRAPRITRLPLPQFPRFLHGRATCCAFHTCPSPNDLRFAHLALSSLKRFVGLPTQRRPYRKAVDDETIA
jgi:hypothetical protein